MPRLATVLSISLLLSSCGRPATVQECEEIANRVATLEYEAASKTKTPPQPEQIQTIRARVHDAMMKGCVGKRITQRALKCVRTAKSADSIQKDCFD
jgi:small lipoprotein (TIGR04454 family)